MTINTIMADSDKFWTEQLKQYKQRKDTNAMLKNLADEIVYSKKLFDECEKRMISFSQYINSSNDESVVLKDSD